MENAQFKKYKKEPSIVQTNSAPSYPSLMSLTPKNGNQYYGFRPRHKNGKTVGYICELDDEETGYSCLFAPRTLDSMKEHTLNSHQ